MRKAAMFGISVPTIAALLAACGGGSDSNSTTATSDATTPSGTTGSPIPSGSPISTGNWKPRDVKVDLTGSGSSFVDPAMQLWVQQYRKLAPHVTINYQSVGSGQGKKDFISGVTDFAGTDAYMTDDELARAPGSLHIPVVLGPVAMTYNLSGVSKLQLSGPTLANIYLGKITRWNDDAIAADNPGMNLPGDAITVVYRADGSGTSAIFTNFLSKVSDEWKATVGFGTAVQWPAGIGGQQNPGVAAAVQQTPGAIGYVELAYATVNELPVAAIKNATGAYVAPSLEATSADAAGFINDLPDDLRVFITNSPNGEMAYPITGFSWVLLRTSYDDEAKAQALTDFCYWAITAGQDVSKTLEYAPLPEEVRAIEVKKLEQVQAGGKAVFTAPM
ncbi:MAG TPA: phosphate ABC transporter substrate-binding protein PstS [Nitrolancea sp.]|nr:phosphate ABC transporter substrate-binding protein PstS [Nitrolancea sp.]